jgi:hypothetical protein
MTICKALEAIGLDLLHLEHGDGYSEQINRYAASAWDRITTIDKARDCYIYDQRKVIVERSPDPELFITILRIEQSELIQAGEAFRRAAAVGRI